MKINGRPSTPSRVVSTLSSGIPLQGNGVKGSSAVRSGDPSGDRIEISSDATDFMAIKAVVAAIPDIREDLVSTLKHAIEKGTYHAPPEIVAEKILQETLMNAGVLEMA